ncbi:MAG TPA: hypothetical protein ENI85_16950 [Deltaproteobacteria bacterium]|nr:hypothetical protein [Deltaproteobacteria bacterium]
MLRSAFSRSTFHGCLVPLLAAIVLVLPSASPALTLDVTGVIGSGFSTWTFSGTTRSWAIPASAQADGALALGSNLLIGRLNNFQTTDFNSGPFGTFDLQNVPLSAGATVAGSTSGVHDLEGFTFQDLPRFAWFANGAFTGNETMTYGGTAIAPFEISLLDGIVNLGDMATVTAHDFVLGDLTMNFTAVPEPSTALFLAGGLIGLIIRSGRGRDTRSESRV